MRKWKTTRLDAIMDDMRKGGGMEGSWWDRDKNWSLFNVGRVPEGQDIIIRLEYNKEEKEHAVMLEKTMNEVYQCGSEKVIEALMSEGKKDWCAWFRSSEFRGSGRFLSGLGGFLTGVFQFTSDDHYRMAIRMRCLVDPPIPMEGPCPLCRNLVAPANVAFHLLDCSHGQWFFTNRHHAVRDVLFDLLADLGHKPQREVVVSPAVQEPQTPEQSSIDSGEMDQSLRADIVFSEPGARVPTLIDVMVTDPAAQSYRHLHPHETADAVAKYQEERKEAKYNTVNGLHRVAPFVVEATGRLGPKAAEWLRYITDKNHYQRTVVKARITARIAYFVTLQMILHTKDVVRVALQNTRDMIQNNERQDSPSSVETQRA